MSQARRHDPPIPAAIIGGSGLYALSGMESAKEVHVQTPFGDPSDSIRVGEIEGRPIAFLARHGRNHQLIPGEINYRANIYALKSLGVDRIFSASAVGSMRERIRPREVVLVDQFIDRTQKRPSTFFGEGIAAHVSFAEPTCPVLREAMLHAAEGRVPRAHDGGTYLCIEGPAFSTRAESELYRSWNVDVIGMTNLQEAKLSREAEICYATLALVTDYDCWHEEEEDVSVGALLANLEVNAAAAAETVREALRRLPAIREGCPCVGALEHALITHPAAIPSDVRKRLDLLIGHYLD